MSKFTSTLILSLALAATSAHAANEITPKYELTTGWLSVGPSASAMYDLSDAGNTTQYTFAGHVGVFFEKGLEVTFDPTIWIINRTPLATAGTAPVTSTIRTVQLLVGPTYNFYDRVQNSPYISAALGWASQAVSLYSTGGTFAYSVTLGHRFEIFEHVSFNPSVTYWYWGPMHYTFDSDPTITLSTTPRATWGFSPLQFSILF